MDRFILKYYKLLVFVLLSTQLCAQECEWLETTNIKWGSYRDVAVDENNDVITVGRYPTGFSIQTITFPSTVTQADGFVAKFNNTGTILWAKQTVPSNVSSSIFFYDVETDKQNNIYAVGVLEGTVDFGNGVSASNPKTKRNTTAVIVKYNSSGITQWAKTVEDTLGIYNSLKIAIANNGYVYAGFTATSKVSFSGTSQTVAVDPFKPFKSFGIAHFDSSGSFIKAKLFGGGLHANYFKGIGIDDNHNIYVDAFSSNGASLGTKTYNKYGRIIVKIDSSLNVINSRLIATKYLGISLGAEQESHISVQPNGKFVFTEHFGDTIDFGGITVIAENGDNNYLGVARNNFIAYYDSSLKPIWVRKEKTLSKGIKTEPWAGVVIKGGHIFFGGLFSGGNTSFGGNPLIAKDSTINFNGYLVKMDTLGNFLWAFTPGNGNVDGIAIDNNFNSFMVGGFLDSIQIFNKRALSNISPASSYFLAKIKDYRITRGYVKPGPYCAGDSFEVPYIKHGRYDTGNYFIAELSDSAGNFEGGQRELGRVKNTESGIVKSKLPLFNVATNNKYRIRILSTKPRVQSFYKKDTLRLLIYSRDTANAGADRYVCKGEQTRLSTTGGTQWQWSPANRLVDTNEVTNRQPLIQLNDSAEYRIIIGDSSGCGVIDTDYVKINVRPELNTQIIGDSAICKGYIQTLRAQVNGGDSSKYWYEWRISGQRFLLSKTATVNVSPSIDRTYLLLVGDSCSSKIDSTYFTITVNTNLKAKVIGDTTLCYGETSILSVLGSGCDPNKYTYEWFEKGNTTVISNNDTLLVTPNNTKQYYVVLKDTSTSLVDTAQVTITVLPKPTLTLNADSTICVGELAELRATAIGGNPNTYSIQWTVNSGLWTSNNPKEIVTPTQTTTYKAILSDGCTTPNDSAEITITVRPKLEVTVNTDTTICIGEQAELRAIADGGLESKHNILWTAVGSQWTVNTPNSTISPNTTTTYKAILSDGCTTPNDSAEITITVRPKLTLTINTDTTICTGEAAELRAITSGGLENNHNIIWTAVGSQWTSNNPITQVTPSATTTYKALLSDGCTDQNDSAELTTTVRAPLQLTTTAKDSICSNETLLLTATLTGGFTPNHQILWTVDNGLWTSTQNPATDTPQLTTKYIAQLSDNCSPTVYDTLQVIVLPIPKADFTATPLSGCPPLKVTLTDNSTDNDSIQNTWTIGQTEYQSTKTQTHEILKQGVYNIKLNVRNQLGCSDEKTQANAITVFAKPKANFIIKPDIKEVEEALQLYNLSQNATQVIWDMGDGNTITPFGGGDTIYIYDENDTGFINAKIIAINSQGCRDTAEKQILLYNKVHCTIPTAFTPNGDDLNNTFKPVCVGAANYTLTIYNRWGQVIYQRENGEWDGTYADNPSPSGVYMYKLQINAQSQKKKLTYGTVQVIR